MRIFRCQTLDTCRSSLFLLWNFITLMYFSSPLFGIIQPVTEVRTCYLSFITKKSLHFNCVTLIFPHSCALSTPCRVSAVLVVFVRPFCCECACPESSSTPLLDLRNVFNPPDECEAGSPEPSAARAENHGRASVKGNLRIASAPEARAGARLHICICHPVKSDALVCYPEENPTYSGAETCAPGSAEAVSMSSRTQKLWRGRQWAGLIFLCRAWKSIP